MYVELCDVENDFVEVWVIEFCEDFNLLGDCIDFVYLWVIYCQLFQDIYVWVGDLWIVGIEKEDEFFCVLGGISWFMEYVVVEIYQFDWFRVVGEGDFVGQVVYWYDYVNYVYLFCEGNGCLICEFFDFLLFECGFGFDWGKIDLEELYGVCYVVCVNFDFMGLVVMFKGIFDVEFIYDF